MKTKLTRLLSILIVSLLSGIYSHAQLTVNTSQTPLQLAQLLTGTGVQILNPQVHGGTNSYGKYNATNSNLNINEGILLTTGLATNAIGPNNTGSMTTYFGNPAIPDTYPLLTNYTGRTIYEYCEIEFDIIPQGDSISFPFVFGSEEFEEWVGSQYNDVFGFFISGPGIVPDPGAGIYKNIALIPNTSTPVTINSVNQNLNTQYYQNNNNGSSVQYDGFTTGLIAVSAVMPCQVYHLKLIVADASDKLWDSGVFIEKISSNSVALSTSTVGGTPFMIEGCNPGTITFTRPNVTNLPLIVTYWIGGSAINGTDYPLITPVPNAVAKHITIPANQASASLPINPFADNIADNNEYITVYLGNPLCPSVLDSIRFYIHDYLSASVAPPTATICSGTSTQLTASGDASAFTWTPSAGLNNPNIPNPVATPSVTTTYNVTSTVGSCTSTLPVTITVSTISLSFTHTNINCSNSATGTASVTASGGFPPYAYAWTGPNGFTASTASISNLAAGTYTVVVTGQQSCTATGTVTITSSPALTVTAGGNIFTCGYNVTCNGGSNGSATATVSGGTAPYTYVWSSSPVQTTATATGLPAGPVSVTVTDANGCTSTATVTLTQPPLLTGTITAQTNVLCFGNATGSATVAGSGGVPPYTYTWNTTPVHTGATASNLAAGTYIVTIRDANYCTRLVTVTITQPATLSATITAQTNITCFGNTNGSATVTVSGGTAPYTYSWNTTPVQTTATATNLSAGVRVVTVADANGCTRTASVTITGPASALNATISAQTNISCFANSTGSATISVTGGTAPYTYSWNTIPVQTTATAINLPAGNYAVIATDANGCQANVAVYITQPSTGLAASISAQTNVSCFGNINGSATVSVIGGVAPYTYSWNTSPVQTTATAGNLGAGGYVVTVTDANGCVGTASVTITQPASAMNATISAQTNVSCFGNTNGSATVSVSGGTAPYSYSWNTTPVQTSATATNLSAGVRVVTITDGNGCITTASVTITEPASALNASISAQTNVSCVGNTGSATVTVSGGTAPYTYSWNTTPVQASATATNLSAGTYVVTITDANGCSATASVTILQPASTLSATISAQTNISCFGNHNGSATVSVTGGTAPYTYSWNTPTPQTTATAINLVAGTYIVTVTDANGCAATATAVITGPSATLNATITAQTNVSCFASASGSATVTATGGTGPYTYLWNTNPAQTTATAINLAAGTYAVIVTDANGCQTSVAICITEPVSGLSATISSQTNAGCFGNTNGSATVAVTGGTAPYTYSWNTSSVQTSATAVNLGAGVYVVTITDANGCTTTASVTISQPAASLSASISAQTNVLCVGNTTGSATVTVTGGTAPYTYSWNTSPVQTSATANNLSAGTYVVTATDANGCSVTASVIILQPAVSLSASISAQTNITCFGNQNGSATVSVTGGTAPYTYSWNTSPIQTSATANNLVGGTYVVTITDANGCTATATATITGPSAALTATITAQVNVSCFANSGGSATVVASGGTGPYTYLWNTNPAQTTATATNLTAGTYAVIVTDANGCQTSAAVCIMQPMASLNVTISSQTNVSCYGNTNGSATVAVTGGTAPYTYSWNTAPVQTTATATNLGAGVYNATITDANGCSAVVSVTITQPAAALSASITAQTNASCFGNNNGSATVSVTGGTAPYTYSWNTATVQTSATASNLSAGTYVVTVTDANGCSATATVTISQPAATLSASISAQVNISCFGNSNGSATVSVNGGTAPYTYSWSTTPAQTSASATNLSAGNYSVSITDANGCTATASISIFGPAAALSATISSSFNVSCFGGANGSATVMATGGTAPYTYTWNTTPAQSGVTASNLGAATYVVTITDANGCSAAGSVTISQPASALSASISAQVNVSCFGNTDGSATVAVTGGTAPYTYSWNTSPAQTSVTAANLGAGVYIVNITDVNGCSASASVTITQPAAALSASIGAQTDVTCFGGTNGSATVSVTGGTAPYTYSWNTSPVQNTATASNLGAAVYTVMVTDANGCTASATVTISQPAATLSATISAQANVNCYGNSTGSATASVSGGTGPYTYSWNTSPVQTTATASNLGAGTYLVTITDANGCSATASVTISEPSIQLDASVTSQTNVSCFGNTTGSATVTASGGTTPYTYIWNTPTPQNGPTATNLSAGNYMVNITDANGCTVTVIVNITQPAGALSASISAQTNVICFGDNTGSATIAVSGGTGPYTYSWSTQPAQLSATASNLAAGTYVVFVVDSNNCSTSVTVVITEPSAPISAAITAQSGASCFNTATGSATVSVSGGTGPYSYSWNTSPVQTGSTASNLAAGNYTVTITDANNCTSTATVSISQPAAVLSTSISSQVDVTCFGGNTGSATISVAGGTAPYTYNWSTSPVQTGATATNLSAGSYTVAVGDANQCSASILVTITQPASALSASITSFVDASCFGGNGSATVTATGGSGSYSYSWNSTPVQTGATASGLPAGSYIVTVTDNNGCTTPATATVIISQPSVALDASATVSLYNGSNISCFSTNDGYINTSVSGGTAPYTYSWTGPASFSSTSQNISGLVAGTYVLTVTDAQGCSFILTQQLIQPASALAFTSTVTAAGCTSSSTGAIDIIVTGGTTAYTYSWSGPANFSSTSEDISGLGAGVYVVTITDANGCMVSDSINVTQPAPMVITTMKSDYNGFNIACAGGNSGSIDVTVIGGTPGYTYTWNGPNGYTSGSGDISGLYAGNYTLTVTDANGCAVSIEDSLTEPSRMLALFTSLDANCSTADGIIAMDILGGTGTYSCLWSTGATQTMISGLTAGSYIVTITDGNGCTMVDTAYVGSASYLAATYVVTNPTCSATDGAIMITITNGNAPFTYAWSNGGTGSSISDLSGGSYSFTVTDSSGCAITDTIQVTAAAPIVPVVTGFVYTNGHNISSIGGNDGSIDLEVTGGSAPYTYEWSTGATTEDISGLSSGQYSVIVIDSAGCSAEVFITLTEPIDLLMPTGFSPNGDGSNDYFVVQGLDNFATNHIEIYNRWGNVVYETDNYNNKWQGVSNRGDALPDGTYFVILEVNGGDIKLNSYVDLRR
ncbi:MAG: choice-of-anchor L domain-containing protein [Bacteroidota bacterium]|nr:choice-of-anchor L domain-containing protein [Bacteroidota bacterium]